MCHFLPMTSPASGTILGLKRVNMKGTHQLGLERSSSQLLQGTGFDFAIEDVAQLTEGPPSIQAGFNPQHRLKNWVWLSGVAHAF